MTTKVTQPESVDTIQPPAKAAINSKTVWLNSATLVFIAFALTLPEITSIIPKEVFPYITALVAVINLYLRVNGNPAPIKSLT